MSLDSDISGSRISEDYSPSDDREIKSYMRSIDIPLLSEQETIELAKVIEKESKTLKREYIQEKVSKKEKRIKISNCNGSLEYFIKLADKLKENDIIGSYSVSLADESVSFEVKNRMALDIRKYRGEIVATYRRAKALEAIDKLVRHNLRLSVFIAKKKRGNMPFQDAVQEASISLSRGAALFDWKKSKFSTYATKTMERRIRKAQRDYGYLIHVPSETSKKAAEIEKESEKQNINFDEACRRKGLNKKKTILLRQASAARKGAYSLDSLSSSGENPFCSYFLLNKKQVHVDENLIQDEERKIATSLLSRVNERDRSILYLRIADGRTLKEIGETYGLTKERVRQIVRHTLVALRIKTRILTS